MRRRFINSKLALLGAIFFLVAAAISMVAPLRAGAAVTNPVPTPKVSFTFDDGLASAYTQAVPTLAKYGLSGTNYVITGCVGKTAVPNTCRANTTVPYMTWTQVQALQNTYGWEIGSHTVDHKCLASNSVVDPADCQAATLTTTQVDTELANSKSALASHGITATDFAPPYGDFNNSVLAEIAKYYATMRQFKNVSNNTNVWPYSDYYLQDITVQEGINTVSQVESQIDAAIANNQWLILTFHEIRPTPSTNPEDYQYGTAELDQIAAYVKAKQDAGKIQSVHVNQGLVTSDTNLLPNSTFDNGIANGWTTDAPASVTKDTANNGSFPSSTNSVKFVSAANSVHLFSPKVSVDPNTTYMLKNFLNVQAISSGEVGFYIDEYDANGNWISGQWKAAENSAFVENMNFAYKPSSVSVSKASLQVYVTANSDTTAYLDNAQWFPVQTTVPTQTNLVANGAFDDGIADGWSTDNPANIAKDANNNGSPSNPVNSISLTALSTAQNIHLFSPVVGVDSTQSYTLDSYLNITQATSGEIAYYIDEYDANGNWISGQYKTGISVVGAGNVGLQYVPSSSSVKKASLQVIVVGGSGIHAYFDDMRWYQN